MSDLTRLKCVPCKGNLPALTAEEIAEFQPVPQWEVTEEEGTLRLQRTFRFKNFSSALSFTNRVGLAAEEEDHHPMLQTEWGKVTVSWWTHAISGLHQNDFIMAAKTDALYKDIN
ncbi:MAG: 4a-hydroxytetrahydrobiopterin dehydratase [Anaerolineaceae bacterium]|nr:4a-hydroxytetrahydrobiopterin dehydratase [Anaerolineaceae bacterium]